MNFTKAQSDAINTKNSSLLVSAGAGSGKTAVLTERILQRICDENDECNITDFLIVTFTNAAAKELSDRIRKKLSERAQIEPENKKIHKNLALLPLARISTINSFCYDIIKNNFHLLDLSASLRIADEAEMAVIRKKIMNEVVDDIFETNGDDKDFIAAYEVFASAKSDNAFIETLLSLDTKLKSMVDGDAFMKKSCDYYAEVAQSDEYFDTFFGKILKEDIKKTALESVKCFEKMIDDCNKYDVLAAKYLPSVENEYDFARCVLVACDRGYNDVRECLKSYTSVRLGSIRDFENQELKELIKDSKNAVSKRLRTELDNKFACSKEQLNSAARDTKRILEAIMKLLCEYNLRLEQRKKDLGIAEFSDAENKALSILVESYDPFVVTDLAKQYRQQYKEIYIDEYQDVNPTQDMIFRALTRETKNGEEMSRFMVGDIKQSIYRFRGASPDIFMNYRDEFSDIDNENSSTRRIFMSDNFRCSENVISFTNFLFKRLMGDYYLKGDELLYSKKEENKVNPPCSLCLFEYDKELAQGLGAEELEAGIIAKKIKEYVNNPMYTNSDGKMYTYKDVAVLTRSKTALRVYESVFSQFGLPVLSDVGESFYGKKEILLCLCILNSIDNPERDIYLAGFMRSFAGAFSDDELALIKYKSRKASLYSSVKLYSQDEETKDTLLGQKCAEFVERLSSYRKKFRSKSAEKILWQLYTEFDLLNVCSSKNFGPDGQNARKNLLKLYEMARNFANTSFRGIGAFIDYIEGSMQSGDIKSERELTGEAVSLMTIHASKGLEFPICFVSDLARKFNKSDESARLVMSQSTGIAVTLCDTEAVESVKSNSALLNIDTPFRKIISSEIEKEGLQEEIRVLYVALTRARERLIMTGHFSKKCESVIGDAKMSAYLDLYNDVNSFCPLIINACVNLGITDVLGIQNGIRRISDFLEIENVDCKDVVEFFEKALCTTDVDEILQDCDIDNELFSKLKNVSGFDYSDFLKIPAKLTVSTLKTGLLDEEHQKQENIAEKTEPKQMMPLFTLESHEEDAAKIGTAMHLFMQFCDFEKCENNGALSQAEYLCNNGFISCEQKDMLDIKKLDEFFSSPFYYRIKKSHKIYREQRFNLQIDTFVDDGVVKGLVGDEILVQGVIDLFFQNDDGTFSVVDFKTDRVFGKDAEQTLVERHAQQLKYYCKAVEEMTDEKVKDAYIYSFSLMREISLEL